MSGLLDRVLVAGLAAGLVFTALAFGTVEPWSIALFELLVLSLLACSVLKAVLDGDLRVWVPPAGWPVLALLAVGGVQSIALTEPDGSRWSLSADVEATRTATLLLFFLTAAFLIASNVADSRERLRGLAVALTALGFGLAIFGLLQESTWNGKIYWVRELTQGGAPFGPFVNRNHFAGYIEMLIPIPVALLVSKAVGESRWLVGFAAIVMGVALVASLSRGGLASFLAGVAFIALMGARLGPGRIHGRAASISRLVAIAAILGAVVGGTLWLGAGPVVSRLTTGSESGSDESPSDEFAATRLPIWRDTLSMIAANPALGVGFGAYETAYPLYNRHFSTTLRVRQAHNDWLQIVADCGAAGAILALTFCVLVLRSVARGIRAPDPLVSSLALGSGAAIVSMMVHSLFDFNLQVPANALLFLFHVSVVSTADRWPVAGGRWPVVPG